MRDINSVRTLTKYAQTTNLFEGKPLGYLQTYERFFESLIDVDLTLLELGVASGQSMKMWHHYFANGTIVGVDLFPKFAPDGDEATRIKIYQGSQSDTEFLTRVARACAPDGFDIIIDDCSHIGELTKISFWHLFENHLKPGGFYAIEDWGTGYWGGYRNVCYPDGEFFQSSDRETLMHRLANKFLKSAPVEWRETGRLQKLFKRYQYTRRFQGHDYGMVGFVKQLIDELGIAEVTGPMGSKRLKDPPERQRISRFAHVTYTPGVVLVSKA